MTTVPMFTGLPGDIQEAWSRGRGARVNSVSIYDVHNCPAYQRAKGFLGCQYGLECVGCANHKPNKDGGLN